MRNTDQFNDWMNDFELPQTNEWQKEITLSHTSIIRQILERNGEINEY